MLLRLLSSLALPLLLLPAVAAGQDAPARTPQPDAATARRIASALLPLPAELRSDARVLGVLPDGRLTTLRDGAGTMICIADDPREAGFHAACYHHSLEPFMARGRALRASGAARGEVDSVRFREVREGTLQMPATPAALYSLTGPPGSYDAATGEVSGARPLFVIYVPNATPESLGISARPARGTPWLMDPGTPKAHIMFTPDM